MRGIGWSRVDDIATWSVKEGEGGGECYLHIYDGAFHSWLPILHSFLLAENQQEGRRGEER